MDFALSENQKLNLKIRTLEFKFEQLQRSSSSSSNDEAIIAKVHTGKIRGSKRLSLYNDSYYSFERVPYALPPLAELRFRAPKPMTPWKNIKDCTWYGARPMQRNPMEPLVIDGSEDCLYLNIYTNNIKPSKSRPVMVWIYGGGFHYGEATREWYGPDYFMKKDIVLITVQYRLGALGFLSLNDPGLQTPGNAGLKDIILALHWIKRNISNFGGNPNNVTLFGESAGAAAANYLMLSEHAQGLFHRAILQSGLANAPWATTTNCAAKAYELAKLAGYEGDAEKENHILKYLLTLPADEIVRAQVQCRTISDREMFAFGPCVEPYFTAHTVICKPIEELLKHTWSNSIPVLLGANSNEGLFYKPIAVKNEARILKLLESCTHYVPKAAAVSIDSPECSYKGQKLRQCHVGDKPPTFNEFYEIITFANYWHPIQKTINSRLNYASKSATFLYRFDFVSHKMLNSFHLMRNAGIETPDAASADCGSSCGGAGSGAGGAAHTDELAYLFSTVLAKPMDCNSREYQCIERMIGLWTAFAETGNPNNGKINGMHNIKWHPLNVQQQMLEHSHQQTHQQTTAQMTAIKPDDSIGQAAWKCLNICDNLNFIDLPEWEKLKVWQRLYEMHHELPKNATEPSALSAYAYSSL